MSTRLRRIKSWDHGSPFSRFFHDLVDDACGAAYRFQELEPEVLRVIMTPGLDEGGDQVEAAFPIIVQGTISIGWPKEYDWVESELVGLGQGIMEEVLADGRKSTDLDDDEELLYGLGINRIELLPGFGDSFGPYGQRLIDGFVRLTVQAVLPGSPAIMVLRTNASGITVPTFEAYNPMTPECNVSPGVPPDIAI